MGELAFTRDGTPAPRRPAAGEEPGLPELQGGWVWVEHFGMWAAERGHHRVCVSKFGVLAMDHTSSLAVDAPIAVVLAVIARNTGVSK